MKTKIDSRTFFRRLALIASPLLMVTLLIEKLLLDQARYTASIEDELLIIYAAIFAAALFETVVKPRR